MENDKRIALLIDADNVSGKYIPYIMDEVSNYGTPTYKRIYGDWTKPQLGSWKGTLLNYSITPVQQYGYTTGKNSTDAALIIDAMDILYSSKVDGFCIVSSDSDFTRLAARLREAGMRVIGMGEKKTPAPFIAACQQFKYLEVLAASGATEESGETAEMDTAQEKSPQQCKPQAGTREIGRMIKSLKTIITELSDEDGWAYLGAVGNLMSRRLPDFDTRNFGFKKMSAMVDSLDEFELELRKGDAPHAIEAYVRNKPAKRSMAAPRIHK